MHTRTKRLEHSQWVCVEGHALDIKDRVTQSAFQTYTMRGWREKPLEVFRQLRAARFLFWLPRADEFGPLQESLWSIFEVYALKDAPSTSRAL